jgi:DNA helicase TIP49 (TBP-interacting protein)
MPYKLKAPCRNCHAPCDRLFCSLACAEERYSITCEALESLEHACRRALGIKQKGHAE